MEETKLFRYSKQERSQLANDLNFIRDTLEKVYRLTKSFPIYMITRL
jgi:hypothetical protein